MMMGKGNMNMASWTSNVDSSNSSDGWGSFGKVATTRSGDDYVNPWTSEADWVCMMCNHRNRATNEVCGGAGPEGCKAPKACSHSSPAFQPPSDSSTMGANVTGVPSIMSSSSNGMSSNSSNGRLSQEQMMQQMMMQQKRPMQQNIDPNMVMGVPGIMSSSSSNGMSFSSSNGGMPQDPSQMQQMMMMQQSQMQPNMDPKMMKNMMAMMMTMMQQMGSPWKCVCGFKNVARNTVCGGKGEGYGCKQPRPQQNMPMLNVSGKGGCKGRVGTGPDWVCELCGFQNKSFNTKCGGSGRLGCKADKPIDVSQPWTCDACNEINDGASTVCNATGCQKPRQARSQG